MDHLKKLLIVTGEASGDAHAAMLLEPLRARIPGLQCKAIGGASLAACGVPLLADLADLSVVGGMEVLKKFGAIRAVFRRAVEYLETEKPDAVLLVDYPGFNLRLAQEAKKRGIGVLYYISPQIWAWAPGRIHKIKRLVDLMLVILPFEKDIYAKAGVPVRFVGHPSLDRVAQVSSREDFLRSLGLPLNGRCVALLPGSRAMEVQKLVPVLLNAARQIQAAVPGVTFLLPCASAGLRPVLEAALAQEGKGLPVRLLDGQAMAAARASDMALVASGTATLETALMLCPMLIVYKVHWATYVMGRLLIRVPFLGLVNILAGECVAPEFLQGRARADAMAREAIAWLRDAEGLARRRERLKQIVASLGRTGASERAAEAIAQWFGVASEQRERLSA